MGNSMPHSALSRSPGASLEAHPDPATVSVSRSARFSSTDHGPFGVPEVPCTNEKNRPRLSEPFRKPLNGCAYRSIADARLRAWDTVCPLPQARLLSSMPAETDRNSQDEPMSQDEGCQTGKSDTTRKMQRETRCIRSGCCKETVQGRCRGCTLGRERAKSAAARAWSRSIFWDASGFPHPPWAGRTRPYPRP